MRTSRISASADIMKQTHSPESEIDIARHQTKLAVCPADPIFVTAYLFPAFRSLCDHQRPDPMLALAERIVACTPLHPTVLFSAAKYLRLALDAERDGISATRLIGHENGSDFLFWQERFILSCLSYSCDISAALRNNRLNAPFCLENRSFVLNTLLSAYKRTFDYHSASLQEIIVAQKKLSQHDPTYAFFAGNWPVFPNFEPNRIYASESPLAHYEIKPSAEWVYASPRFVAELPHTVFRHFRALLTLDHIVKQPPPHRCTGSKLLADTDHVISDSELERCLPPGGLSASYKQLLSAVGTDAVIKSPPFKSVLSLRAVHFFHTLLRTLRFAQDRCCGAVVLCV